jgi:trigger factor
LKVDLARPENNVALLTVEIDADRINQARQLVYRRLVGRYNVPGFRRGRAPQPILERYVGPAFFDQELLDELLTAGYPQAVEQAGIEPVTSPDLDILEWSSQSTLRFTAKVTTKPTVALGQYTGLEVPKAAPAVSDGDVDAELGRIRDAFGKFVAVSDEEPLIDGSIAVIDFVGYIDGEPFAGGEAKAYPLTLGSGTFTPGFEEQLVGVRPGEDREITVTFPETYNPELAGKTATFRVHVSAQRRRVLPELDDTLAGRAAPLLGFRAAEGEEFDLAALRAAVRGRLELAAARRTQEDYEERVLAKVAAGAVIDVPEVMVDRGVESRWREYAEMFIRNGATLEQYLEERNMTADELRGRLRPAALEGVRRELVLEAVGRKEGITATDREVDERILSLAQVGGEEPAALRTRLAEDNGEGIERLRDELMRRKIVDFLVGAQVAVPLAGIGEPQAAPRNVQPIETSTVDVTKTTVDVNTNRESGSEDASEPGQAADEPRLA